MLETQRAALWSIGITKEAKKLIKWWNESDEGEDVLIARLVGHGGVPRGLRRRILLERGDEGLIISPNNEAGKPLRGPDEVRTKEVLRGSSEILIYNRLRTYDFEFAFEHLNEGGIEPLTGILKLGVRVLDEIPTLIKDRLLSGFPGKREVLYSDVHDAIEERLASRWGEVLEGSEVSNRKDPGRQEEARKRALSAVRDAIGPVGLYSSEADILWGDTEEERFAKEVAGADVGAFRDGVVRSAAESRVWEMARQQREKVARERRERASAEKHEDAIRRMERETEIRVQKIENQRLIGRAHGLEL